MDFRQEQCHDRIDLKSVVPYSKLTDDRAIDFGREQEIFKVNYPILMGIDRVVSKREDILFERNARSLKCKVKEFCETEKGDKIVFI